MRREIASLVAAGLVLALAPGAAGASAIDDYEKSWTHRALALQYDLAGDVELRNAPFVGTHNSFNSEAEMGTTLSDQDSNQQLALVDQLRLDIRSLELDLHWFPSARSGRFRPVVCHARGEDQAHFGCTIEKELGPVLDEIAGWLRAHRDQVLLLYLEDDLGSRGHDESARTLEQKLGSVIYRPSGGGTRCVPLPLEVSRADVLAAGKQVILVSDCGRGTAWRSVVFDWSAREEERPRGYTDFPRCGPDFDRATYDRKLVRYYEDSTQLTARAGTPDEGITPPTAARMARCGVDLLGLDQLLPTDGRLDALVWSWAKDDRRANGPDRCAVQRVDARWRVFRCTATRRVACLRRDGSWAVSRGRLKATLARRRCRRRGHVHAAPRTGYEGQLLRETMRHVRAGSVWLGLRRRGDRWVALDSR